MNKTTPVSQRTQPTTNSKFKVVKGERILDYFETLKGATKYARNTKGKVVEL